MPRAVGIALPFLASLACCTSTRELDALRFVPSATHGSTTSVASGGGKGSGGGAGGAPASSCGPCNGRCVQGRCCQAGGAFQSWSVTGGRVGSAGIFVQLDGKGPLEAAFANDGGLDVWFFRLGEGGIASEPFLKQPIGTAYIGGFSFADMDGDGFVDMMTSHYTPKSTPDDRIEIHYGTATGFAEASWLTTPRFPSSPTAVDFDGDGDLDLRLNYNPGPLPSAPAVRMNLGNRTFGPPLLLDPPFETGPLVGPMRGAFPLGGSGLLEVKPVAIVEVPNALPAIVQRLEFAPDIVPATGAVADLDGDGDDDVLITTKAAGTLPRHLLTYLRSGVADLELCEAIELPESLAKLDDLEPGDFDSDGHPDVLGVDRYDESYPSDDPSYPISRYVFARATFP